MKDTNRRMRGLIIYSITGIVVVSLIIFLVWSLRPLIMPVAIGILLAYLFRPLKTIFKYRWMPETLRATIIFSALTGSLILGVKFVQNNIPNEKENLELKVRLKYKFNEKFEKLMGLNTNPIKGNAIYNLIAQDINPIRTSLNKYLSLSPEQIETFLKYRKGVEGFEPVADNYYQYFLENTKKTYKPKDKKEEVAVSASPNIAANSHEPSLLLHMIGTLSVWLLMPIVFIFFLFDDGTIDQYFIRLFPNRYFELALTLQEEVDGAIGKYLRGISMECALVAISMVICLYAIGVSFKVSIIIGVLTGVATVIPFLGTAVGLISGIVYVLIAEDLNPLIPFVSIDNAAIAVIIVNIVVHLLDNMVFQPIVLGGAVNLHPLVIIIGLLAGSMLFGAAGSKTTELFKVCRLVCHPSNTF
jgi:predicted PurR-regulated permease PerM